MIVRTYPPRIGGPGTVVQRISRELVKRGHDVAIVTQMVDGAPSYEVNNGVMIYRTRNMSDVNEFTFSNIVFGVLLFSKKIFDLREYDVFHAHDISVAGFSGCLARHVIHKPFVLKYGGDLVYEYLSIKNPKGWDSSKGIDATLEYAGLAGRFIRRVQGWYFKTYDIIAPDAYCCVEHLAKGWGVENKKIRVLVNGVDTMKFAPRDKAFDKKRVKLVTTGRLIESKGIDVLLNALPSILKRCNAELTIVGDGPERGKLEALVTKLSLGNHVVFTGKVMPDEMSRYLDRSDIFVFPSYKETTPNSLLEAMSAGLPCIVCDVDGVREVVSNDCALKVDAGDVSGIALAVMKLADNSMLRGRLSKNARHRIVESYSWDRAIENYVRLYESLSH